MFTWLKTIFDSDHKVNELKKNLENDRNKLESLLPKKQDQESEEKIFDEPNGENDNGKLKCYENTGVVTSVTDNFVIIDYKLKYNFPNDTAISLYGLEVGCRLAYLACNEGPKGTVRVVKILNVLDEVWDKQGELLTDEQLDEEINLIKKSGGTKTYETYQKTFIGIIIQKESDTLYVDCDDSVHKINPDDVVISFVPMEGDHVILLCETQYSDDFFDKSGEILKFTSILPARLLKNEKLTVTAVYDTWGKLNDDSFYINDILPVGCKPKVDDIVEADLIECERHNLRKRAVKLEIKEHAAVINAVEEAEVKENQENNNNQQVTVTKNIVCTLNSTFQKKCIEVKITNNREKVLRVNSIIILGKRADSKLNLKNKDLRRGFDLGPLEERSLEFEVFSKVLGETYESFLLKFERFSIKRSIRIIVCESEEEVQAALEKIEKPPLTENTSVLNNRANSNRNRFYANKVWNSRSAAIPGVSLYQKRRFVAHRIGSYDVPVSLREAYLVQENRIDMQDAIERFYPFLKDDLSIKNYAMRFHALIHLEEIECFVNFRAFDRDRAHFQREQEFLALEVENLAERRPSLVIGDIVRAINPWSESGDKNAYDGVIHKVLHNRVLLKFNPNFQSKYNGEDYRLEFYFSRFSFRKQHYAVQKIVRLLGEEFLFPQKIQLQEKLQLNAELDEEGHLSIDGENVEWHNKILNIIQKKAICNILRGEVFKMPYIIFGPPGTGKTITIVETILQIMKNVSHARILVGSPSNSSADLIATRLIDSEAVRPGDFVRLVSQTFIEKDLVPEHLCQYCATIDIGLDGSCENSMTVTASGLKLRCQMKYLGTHKVYISTCSTLGNFHMLDFPPDHFTHIIIDEAGQCTEPDIMIAISQVSLKRGQVILAGDPNQLQAIVTNRYAQDKGYAQSFLDRILQCPPYFKDNIRFPHTSGFDPRLVTKLIYNYRALPSVLKIYNDLFYDSELVSKVDEFNSPEAKILSNLQDILPYSEKRSASHGVYFYGLRSENKQERDSPSWYNPLEAKHVFVTVFKLYSKDIQAKQIGIISPYTKQVKHLRLLFQDADIPTPKIGSVEEFQGQERDIIIISTVRSTSKQVGCDLRHALGFVQNPKRTNVAISRARCLTLVIGNPHLLCLDPSWQAVIKYCVDNDAYAGCDLPKSLENIQNQSEEEDSD